MSASVPQNQKSGVGYLLKLRVVLAAFQSYHAGNLCELEPILNLDILLTEKFARASAIMSAVLEARRRSLALKSAAMCLEPALARSIRQARSYISKHACEFMYVRMCACMYVCMHVCMYVYMHECIYVCIMYV